MSYRRSRSPSPGRYSRRSPSPKRYSRSPSPRYRRYSRSPSPRYRRYSRSPSPRYRRRSPPRYRRRSPRVVGSERDRRESTCLFVGNLPYHFREKETAEYFERFGPLRNVAVGINKRTGQSKGYAFVEYEDRRDAEDAFDRFQGYNLEGRKLRIDWDIGVEKKGPRGPPSERFGSRRSPPPRRYSRSPPRRFSRTPPPIGGRSVSPRPRSPRSPSPKTDGAKRDSYERRSKSPVSPPKRSRSPDGGNLSPRDNEKRQKTDENPL